jgi:hypothetical protein
MSIYESYKTQIICLKEYHHVFKREKGKKEKIAGLFGYLIVSIMVKLDCLKWCSLSVF